MLVREGQRRAEDVVAEVEARELVRVAEDLVGVLGRAEARGRGLDGPRVRDAALAQLVRVELERELLVLRLGRGAVDAVRRAGDGEAQRSAVARAVDAPQAPDRSRRIAAQSSRKLFRYSARPSAAASARRASSWPRMVLPKMSRALARRSSMVGFCFASARALTQ